MGMLSPYDNGLEAAGQPGVRLTLGLNKRELSSARDPTPCTLHPKTLSELSSITLEGEKIDVSRLQICTVGS